MKPLKGWQNDKGAIYLNAREVAAMNAAGEQIGVKDQHLLRSVVTWYEANAFGIPKSGSNQLFIVTTMN
ncbi:hypothetical protein [Heyndrickxia faecalis]|jgi:hypothetical protein